jgi:hypothetical protein
VLNLFITFTIPASRSVVTSAGAVAGALCGFVMLAPKWKPYPKAATYATTTLVAVVAAITSVVVATG